MSPQRLRPTRCGRLELRGPVGPLWSAADNEAMRATDIITGFLVIAVTTTAGATPNAATWRRQTLIGENAGYFFRFVAVSENPASYYRYRRTLRLEKVRKVDVRVVEQIPLRDATYSQNLETDLWSELSETLPPFDLSEYLRINAVHIAFADDLIRAFAIDSSGVWEEFEDGRVRLADRQDLLGQIPNLGEEPRVVGIENTDFQPVQGGKGYVYLHIWSNSASSDADWSEDVLLVDRGVFR